MKIFPLTKGLLVSMAMRADHSYGLSFEGIEIPDDYPDILRAQIHTNATHLELINEMKKYYTKFSNPNYTQPEWGNNNTERQLFEEVNGSGFYKPELEESYAKDYSNE